MLSVFLCAVGFISVVFFLTIYRRRGKVFAELRAKVSPTSSTDEVDGVGQVQPPQLVRVLCQNMWCTNSLFAEAKKSRGPRSRDRFDALVSESAQYDVLVLQELFVMRVGIHVVVDDVAHLCRKLVGKGFAYHTDVIYNLPSWFGQSAGVAIFSRWPIRNCGYATFDKRSLKDFLNQKGYVRATVEMPSGNDIHVFSTHMDSMEKGSVRLSQIEELSAAVQRVKGSGRVMVAGDFNIHRKTVKGANEYKFLVDKFRGLNDVFPNVERDHLFISSKSTSTPPSSRGKIELVTNKTLNLTTPDGLAVSDHSGLSVSISVR